MEITVNTAFREIFESEEFRDYQQFMIMNSPEYTEKLKGYTPATMQADYPNREARSVVMGLHRFREIVRSRGQIAWDIYTPGEIEEDPRLGKTKLFFFPGNPGEKFVLLCAGGAFRNVCNMSEAFPVAAKLNELGYNVFCLSYKVRQNITRDDWPVVKAEALGDVSRAVGFILKNAAVFRVSKKNYGLGGFSAGCMLTGTWCIGKYGWQKDGLPAPGMAFMIYGYVDDLREVNETFPKAVIVANKDDGLFSDRPTFLTDWSTVLTKMGVSNKLLLGETGGHGFGLGLGTDSEGWVEKAAAFWEEK